MQKALFIKVIVVLLLATAINIPLGMVRGLVEERLARQSAVTDNVAKSYAEAQRIANPLLVLPYVAEYTLEDKRHSVAAALYLLPAEIAATGQIATDIKRRGLFRVPVYTLDSAWKGRFEAPAELDTPRYGANTKITWGKPYLSLPVSDPRGLAGSPQLTVDGKKALILQGSGINFMPGGVHAEIDGLVPGQKRSLEFALDFKLRGTASLKVLPLAENLRMELASNWQHPGFEGRFLPNPDSQQSGAEGFRARWDISSLATDAHTRLGQIVRRELACPNAACLDHFEIRLVEPVNVYLQAERALKYGFLLIIVAFAAFFLFEILKGLAIHPAQYTLVGLALAMFFLLLPSLAEHLDFAVAYAIAASACVALIGVYLGAVMGGGWRGAGFSGLLGAFYGALYGLLVSEDNALLMGSLLLFILLAAAMLATRNVDWYRVTQKAEVGQ